MATSGKFARGVKLHFKLIIEWIEAALTADFAQHKLDDSNPPCRKSTKIYKGIRISSNDLQATSCEPIGNLGETNESRGIVSDEEAVQRAEHEAAIQSTLSIRGKDKTCK